MTQRLAERMVLVVEDDFDVRDAVHFLLEDLGMRVLTAGDGQEALDLLRKSPELPSLILLDLMMPNMNGYQFRDEQTNDPRLAAIPVVVFSADGRIDDGAHDMGGVPCLRKPVDMDLLVAALVRQLGPLPSTPDVQAASAESAAPAGGA